MKRIVTIALTVIAAFALSSCSKDLLSDPADAFVGNYSLSVTQHVIWGSDSGTLSDNGRISITKISSSKIQVTGYFRTTGEVVGSQVYFEGTYGSDSYGSISTTYGVGTLSGNVLTFTATQSGQLATSAGGYRYPYRSTDSFTAIKQ